MIGGAHDGLASMIAVVLGLRFRTSAQIEIKTREDYNA
jgi:hypothetical protein